MAEPARAAEFGPAPKPALRRPARGHAFASDDAPAHGRRCRRGFRPGLDIMRPMCAASHGNSARPSSILDARSKNEIALSIIIVNWKVRDLLRRCLKSVEEQLRLLDSACEIIVVDNASQDGSVEMMRAEFPGVSLIESQTNLGFGAGCNLAYGRSSGRFVLLLNPDAVLTDHAIDGLLNIMGEMPRAGIVAPRLVDEDRSFQPASGGALPTLPNVAWNYLFLRSVLPRRLAPPPLFLDADPQGLLHLEWVSGAAMLLRREAIGETIFDESFFMFGEDMDLCDRTRRKGWEVLYSSRQSVVHHQGRSFSQQRSLDILANAHEGPRRVFAKTRGKLSLIAYDAIMLAAFAIRWGLFRLLAAIRPGLGYDQRATYSSNYVRAMLHASRRRR